MEWLYAASGCKRYRNADCALVTFESLHENQVVILLIKRKREDLIYLYDLRGAAYDAKRIDGTGRNFGYVLITDKDGRELIGVRPFFIFFRLTSLRIEVSRNFKQYIGTGF